MNNNNSTTLFLLENAIINGFLNYISTSSASDNSYLNQLISPQYQMENILNNIYSSTGYNQAIETSMQEDTSVKHVLSEEGKQKLNIVLYDKKIHPDKICPIHQTPFTQHEKITQLPCKHIFKSEAIMHWLEKEKAECPVCRIKLPSKEASYSSHRPIMPLLDSHPLF